MNTNTQVTYQFIAIDNASKILNQISDSLQKIRDMQKDTETLKVGVEKIHNISRNTEKMNTLMSKSIITMKTMKKAINLVTDSLSESSAWTENLHMFEMAFGTASKEAYDFSMKISRAFSASQNEVIRYTALFNQMATAIGLANDTAEKMSYTLTALGYDIASLYNLNIGVAMEKLRAGIAGQTKPLRQLGMDITAQSLDKYLKETLKLTDVTSKMLNQSDKMLLRTIVIMSQATNSYGDMAETINTFANQVKVMQGAIQNLKLAIGDFAKSYLAPIVSGIAGFIIALTSIIRAFVPEEAETGIENVADAIGDVNDELDSTINKMGLLSFDKFNALSKPGGNNGFADMTEILENKFGELYEKYMTGFNNAMEKIENKANQIALAITQWIFPLTEFDEETGKINVNLSKVNGLLQVLYQTLKFIVVLAIVKHMKSFVAIMQTAAVQTKLMSMNAKTLGTSMASLKMSLQALSGVFAVVLIYGAIEVVKNWNKMNTAMKVISVTLLAVVAALYLYSSGLGLAILQTIKFSAVALANVIKVLGTGLINALKTAVTWLGTLSASTWVCVGAFAVLTAGIAVLAVNWDKMGSWQKVITIFSALTAAALAAAIAIGVFHASWTLGIGAAAIAAGVTLVIGSMAAAKSATKFADGGYPDKGTMFYAGEAGPEVVANVGNGQTGVMNLAQFEEACYRGTARAISDTNVNRSTDKVFSFNLDRKEFARAIVDDIVGEIRRKNIKL